MVSLSCEYAHSISGVSCYQHNGTGPSGKMLVSLSTCSITNTNSYSMSKLSWPQEKLEYLQNGSSYASRGLHHWKSCAEAVTNISSVNSKTGGKVLFQYSIQKSMGIKITTASLSTPIICVLYSCYSEMVTRSISTAIYYHSALLTKHNILHTIKGAHTSGYAVRPHKSINCCYGR